jgi:glycosyltransferase involved in cell wall biosynthesis
MKKELTVLYGQAPEFSTSFQTRELARHLEPWFNVHHSELPAGARVISRAFRNFLWPAVWHSYSEYLLYGNDGLVDLQGWRGCRLLYWYDAPEDWSQKRPTKFKDRLRCNNVAVANHVFAVSAAQVKIARAIRPGREDSVHYLPVGVDCEFFDPAKADREGARKKFNFAPDDVVVGYLGYLGRWQNRFAGEALLEAAPLLSNKKIKYLVIGSGPALLDWKKKVAELDLQNQFTFTGFIPSADLPSALAAADICVDTLEPGFHSEARSETKLKQYMAMGRACVATNIGENRVDLDEGRAGLLAEPNSNSLSQAILRLAANAGERAALGAAARERAETVYSWRVLAATMAARLGVA